MKKFNSNIGNSNNITDLFSNWKIVRDNDLEILLQDIDEENTDNMAITLLMLIGELICFNDIQSFDADSDVIEIKKFKIYFQISEFYHMLYTNQSQLFISNNIVNL